MVAHLLRLRLDLLWGALRGTRAHVVRVVIGVAVLVLVVGGACVALLLAPRSDHDSLLVVTVTGGFALTAGFAIAPIMSGSSDPLDPRRFLVFGPDPRALAGAALLAGFVSVPIATVAALAICAAVVWVAVGAPWFLAVASVLLALATCVLLARVFLALSAMLLRRRPVELTGVFVIGLLVVVLPVGVFLASLEWGGEVPGPLLAASRIAALTPFGAAWSLPGLAAAGDPLVWVAALVAVATAVGLAFAWFAIARWMLSHRERPVGSREGSGLGWFAVTPGTPAGVIAARSLVYWLRDRRYLVNVVVVPIAAVLTVVPLLIAGVPVEYAALVPVPIMALFSAGCRTTTSPTTRPPCGCISRAGCAVPPTGWGASCRRSSSVVPAIALFVPIAVAVGGTLVTRSRLDRGLPVPVPERPRPVEHRLRGLSVRRDAAGRQPFPTAAAQRGERDRRSDPRHAGRSPGHAARALVRLADAHGFGGLRPGGARRRAGRGHRGARRRCPRRSARLRPSHERPHGVRGEQLRPPQRARPRLDSLFMSTPLDSPDQGGLATLDRELEELIREETIEPGDHERFSHYVKKEKILESALTGKPVRALCGKKWTPGRDPRSSRSARPARRSTSPSRPESHRASR